MCSEPDSRAAAAAAGLCGPGAVLRPLSGGRNSRVFLASGPEGPCVLKLYAPAPRSGRDRMAAEFAALGFLSRHGVAQVPAPLALDPALRCAAYGLLPGVPMDCAAATPQDVDQALDFWRTLHGLRAKPDAAALPLASEACLSLAGLQANLEQRRAGLSAVPPDPGPRERLASFLAHGFDPLLAEALDLARRLANGLPEGLAGEIPAERRTLSPSDFGFHNALRGPDGSLGFVDFEHFGWDDPAKLAADFSLHPAMSLAPALAERFAAGVAQALGDPWFAPRLRAVRPLYALKWCLILLNEFLADDLQRRRLAGDGRQSDEILLGQLAKAEAMLARARRETDQSKDPA